MPIIPCPRPPKGATSRRLVAVGVIRRAPGRTYTLTATPSGVAGRITSTGGAR